ncbi:peroxisomal biogenesis factor 19-like [Strongylocentrotus purpuratus]|uniref:Peroxin-19 n=1 Tax=Strongylocentrotus purpuratus TaxID=7668 RepID=A0A7M7NBX3_STRPU|nr:peroxisomal biogenesis factor 19-like [Strongylocentrotus purpuratus]
MATKSEIEDEASATTPVEEKPSKESLSQMVDSESKDDTDLDLLLDSALGDFDKPLQPATLEKPEVASSSPGLNIMTTSKEQEGEKKTEKQTKEGPQLPPNQDALFEALFNESPGAQQSVADFENVLSGLMSELGEGFGGDPQMASEMQRMFQTMAAGAGAGAGAGAMPNPAAGTPASTTSNTSDSNTTQTPEDVTSTLTDTLTRLAQNAKDLQEGGVPDEELLRSFGGMNMEGDNAELLPMVQTMMQSLLSKDILYPSLKEVVDKYQGWLDEKKPTLSSEDHQRYTEQHRLMSALCVEYEAEQDSDGSTVKQERMGRIMELIQKMESLGQPPAEIVGDMNAGMPFDENGMPRIPGMPQGDQCSIM